MAGGSYSKSPKKEPPALAALGWCRGFEVRHIIDIGP
jgi:hypothetical protein